MSQPIDEPTKKYIVAIETVNGVGTEWLASWSGYPGRTCFEEAARRYPSSSSATYALARARKYHDFPFAVVMEVFE